MLCDGKTHRPLDRVIGTALTLHFPCTSERSFSIFEANHFHYRCSDQECGDSHCLEYVTHFTRSSRLPLNFNPLHFNHCFSCSTVYSSGSLSNIEPGTSSSSVKTVKDWIELLAIPLISLAILPDVDFVCLSHDGGFKFHDIISAKRYCACTWSRMLKERGKWLQLRFNIPNIPENKTNVERRLKQSLKAFKLFQHRFNILSTRFNDVERGWQTLSTLPFSKIERMLKQMLKPFTRAFTPKMMDFRRSMFANSFGTLRQHFNLKDNRQPLITSKLSRSKALFLNMYFDLVLRSLSTFLLASLS